VAPNYTKTEDNDNKSSKVHVDAVKSDDKKTYKEIAFLGKRVTTDRSWE